MLTLIGAAAWVGIVFALSNRRVLDTHNGATVLENLAYRVGVITVATVTLCIWIFLTNVSGALPKDIFPSPQDVIDAVLANFRPLLIAAAFSTSRLLVSFGFATIAGLATGLVVGRSHSARYLIPYTQVLAVLPPIVLAPFFYYLLSPAGLAPVLHGFGDRIPGWVYDEGFKIAVTSFCAYWVVFSAALKAAKGVPREFLLIAEQAGASTWRRLRDVVLPLSLPSVLWDSRIGLTVGFVVLLYVEGIGSSAQTRGLGGFIDQYLDNKNNAALLSLIVLVAIIVRLVHSSLDFVTTCLVPWQQDSPDHRKGQSQKPAEDRSVRINSGTDPEIIRLCTREIVDQRRHFPDDGVRVAITTLHVDLPGRAVLRIDRPQNLPLRAHAGEVIAIIGETGNGKTTLSKALAGFQSFEGDIGFFRDGVPLPEHRGVSPDVAYMFQEHALFPHLSVGSNVAFMLKYRKGEAHLTEQRCTTVLRLVGLDHCRDSYPFQLSGGQRQKLALARVLLIDKPILIIDEGLSSVDQPSKSLLRCMLRTLTKDLRLTTFYISHDREDVLQIADRIWYLKNGTVVADGGPRALYYDSRSVDTARFLGHTNFFRGTVSDATLNLTSYLDRNDPFGALPIATTFGNGSEHINREVIACIPKDWIRLSTGADSVSLSNDGESGFLRLESIVGEPTFSGSEWEIRIRVVSGAEFDVVMLDSDFSALQALPASSVAVNFIGASILTEDV